MADRPRGFTRFLLYLVYVPLFPFAWARAHKIAGRHTDTEPRARGKVVAGMLVGLVLAGGVAAGLYVLHEDGKAAMYDAMQERLRPALGDDEYQAGIDALEGALNSMNVAAKQLGQAGAPGDLLASYQTTWEGLMGEDGVLDAFRTTTDVASTADRVESDLDTLGGLAAQMNESLAEGDPARLTFGWTHANQTGEAHEALDTAREATEGHVLFRQVIPDVQAQDDDAVQDRIAASPLAADVQDDVDAAFAIKNDALSDMQLWGALFFVPIVLGVLYAPLVWALGSVLRTAYEPSESVGYKRYPGGAMGWVLLLGAGGWFAWLFAAWSLHDMDARSLEGQIAL